MNCQWFLFLDVQDARNQHEFQSVLSFATLSSLKQRAMQGDVSAHTGGPNPEPRGEAFAAVHPCGFGGYSPGDLRAGAGGDGGCGVSFRSQP